MSKLSEALDQVVESTDSLCVIESRDGSKVLGLLSKELLDRLTLIKIMESSPSNIPQLLENVGKFANPKIEVECNTLTGLVNTASVYDTVVCMDATSYPVSYVCNFVNALSMVATKTLIILHQLHNDITIEVMYSILSELYNDVTFTKIDRSTVLWSCNK